MSSAVLAVFAHDAGSGLGIRQGGQGGPALRRGESAPLHLRGVLTPLGERKDLVGTMKAAGVKRIWKLWEEAELEERNEVVRVFRTMRAYDKGIRKLHFALGDDIPSADRKAPLDAMQQTGANMKQGLQAWARAFTGEEG